MPDTPSNTNNSSTPIPQITSLSIAFPLNFESPENETANDPRRASNSTQSKNRPPHRHDAGE